MQIFITGANGFIGGAVASALIADGHTVRGLVRSKAKADAVQRTASKQPLDGCPLIAGLSGSGKPLIHGSGSSIVADLAIGEPSDRIFRESTPIEPHAAKVDRAGARCLRHPLGGALQHDEPCGPSRSA